ncbi:MAG: isoprenylcysteine carboxylmethyltransferase family protein [Anaerolineales bacterium]|nr:isoprenylcysteine carboxylmethyltransferase family protein [Anaerolineales bacterium]
MEPIDESDGSLTRGIIRWGIRGLSFKLFVAALLMISAGRWDWVTGWLYVAVFLLFDVATALVVLPRSPELLIERSDPQGGMQDWDKVIMPLASGLLPMVSWIVAGLNERFGWPPHVGSNLQTAALGITVVGYGIVVWSMWANAYFSPVARIQSERGHTVATAGPYRIIRHPGYFGAILFTVAVPLMLASWWALIPGIAGAVLLIVRTALEDQFLHEELKGYREYAHEVEHRLIPGVW